MQPGHEFQADAGQLFAPDLPHGLAAGRDFEHARRSAARVGAGNQRVTVRQAHHAVRSARRRHLPHHFSLGIVLAHHLQPVVRHQVVAIGQAPRVAHIRRAAVGALRQQPDLPDDATLGIHLQKAAGITFADKRVAAGKPLAGVDLAGGFVGEHHLAVARYFLDAVSRIEEQVAVGKHPDVVGVRSIIAPLRFAAIVHHEDLALGVIGTGKSMARRGHQPAQHK